MGWVRTAAPAAVAGLLFAVLRPSLGEGPYTDGLLGRIQWGAFGAALWGICLITLIQIDRTDRPARGWFLTALVASALGGFTVLSLLYPLEVDRLAETILTVVIAIALIGGTWVALNMIVGGAGASWNRFVAAAGAIVAAIAFAIMRGNLSLTALVVEPDAALYGAGEGWPGRLEWPIFGAALWGIGLFVMRSLPMRAVRVLIGVALGAVTGWLIGTHSLPWQRPALEGVTIAVAIAVCIAIAVLAGLRRVTQATKNYVVDGPQISTMAALIPAVLVGAGVGWTIATWFLAPFLGSESDAVIAAVVPLALLGARIAWNDEPSYGAAARFQTRAQALLFLGPAVLFLSAGLVIPAIRTIFLSLLDRNFDSVNFEGNTFDGFTAQGDAFIGLDNYRTLWNDVDSFDLSRWQNIFGSQLFWIALALIVTGVVAGFASGTRQNGEASFVGSGSSIGAMAFGTLMLAFAVFASLRGTFFNNLWWVVTVTSISVVLGLTIAVLAESAGRLESVAKSMIFMPMAISFVGASIVWRLQYQPRDPSKPQTGVLNALWVQLGRLSHSGFPRILALIVLALIFGLIIYLGVRRGRLGQTFGVHVGLLIAFGYLFIELLRRSLGGFRFDLNGDVVPDTIVFLQEPPFNNVFLMIILIWIQTGFAMVILSAAIKAVPPELTEAARVDGATESQSFFQVVLPQILPTVGVVTTTLIVLVTKVFDIVKVSTGGNFGTNVLANDMYEVSFSFGNFTLGSAIAVFILISVLPVMFINVRRMQKARMA